MSWTFPLDMPTAPAFTTTGWNPQVAAGVAQSPFAYNTQVQLHQGRMWMVQCQLPVMRRANAEKWITWRLKLDGPYGSFLLGDQDAREPRGNPLGAPVVNGGGQTGQTLHVRGFTPGAGRLLAGDYIQLGSGEATRLHKVLDDVDVLGSPSGEAAVSIWPQLREPPADGAVITTSNCKGTFMLASSSMPWSTDALSNYEISFDCYEKL